VQLMGSDIHVESRLGEGSRFWFDLDLPVEEFADGAEPSQRSITGYQGSRKKVLVVDDVAGNRAVVTALLSSLGFETFEAMNGEALAQAAAHEPDLIILDVVMPVMDGVEATRRLRQAPALEDVPIIAVSASASGPDPSLSVAAGANAFLPKPLDFDRLLQQTGTLLQLTWTYELPQEARQAVAAIHAFELDKLYKLAMTGNMREIREWATQVAMLDERYRPFADHLHRLAEAFQSKAILALVGEYRAGGRA